ncbi:DUF262 domain-containing protein [Acetobacter orientalis]|uniref:DUF262 domain-containing protein n=1 Tax=Acetobacter orientalis TaxID=146474 RepID=UPI00209D33CB|nr:DUF262 domain-containing protein [Acetobacter orientalis]MCP1215787.1 DUF262 domain-containing protein [Acetobacter orientalis]MCP1217360.1 DUF262 domain-containing protein [Acetobacter orientalis]
MMENINNQVLSVRQLLALTQLSIPMYQRPYRWGARNIADLFTDLATHQNKSAYRLGSVVFHQYTDKGGKLDIVDGQQRTLTLMLTVKALIEVLDEESRDGKKQVTKFQRQDIRQQLEALREPIHDFMKRTHFPSRASEVNLRRNYLELHRTVARSEFDEQKIDFLLNKCQVVCFVLEDISEAFQFFDSQNARGRDLAPHDLLKAFHLREFAEHEACRKAEAVDHWERLPSNELAHLFAFYLYRVRRWAEGKSARYFRKEDVDIFKGVNLDRVGHFPYIKSLRIAHHFVDDYNNQYQRKIDGQHMVFPFHLDQMIINGRRFFEMAEHYQKLVATVAVEESASKLAMLHDEALTTTAVNILSTLNSYKNRHRTGDRYVRAMFDCALIFYIDKFGSQELSLAIEKCFIWAYRCRIRQQVIQLATMDNYVLEHNLIRAIRDAHQPSDLQAFYLPNISSKENKNNRNDTKDELVKLFQEMNYYV